MKKKDLEKIGRLSPQVLIAGGASYLGTKLAEELLDNGFKVWVVDDFSSGKSVEFKNLCSNKNFHFWTADINKQFPEEIRAGSLDFVFHLARLEFRSREDSRPLSTLVTNATGTKNLLDLAKEKKARFLLASSVGVVNVGDHEENISPVLEAKRFAEALVSEYREEFRVNARVARLGEIYGPSMDLDSSGSLGHLLKNLLTGDALTIYGEGLQKEYYVYISDAVNGLCTSMFSAGGVKNWKYIVAPREPITTLELAYKIRAVSAVRVKLEFSNASGQEYKIPVRALELQGEYPPGWQPNTSLERGLKDTISAFRQKKAYQNLEAATRTVKLGQEREAKEKKPSVEKKERSKRKTDEDFKVDFTGILESFNKLFRSVYVFISARTGVFLTVLVLLCFAVAAPAVQYKLFRTRASAQFLQAEDAFTALDLELAVQRADNAKRGAELSQGGIQSLRWALNLFGAEERAQKKIQELRTLKYFSQYIYYASKAVSPLETVLRTDSKTVSGANYYVARGDVARARQMLLMAEAELSAGPIKMEEAAPIGGWRAYIVRSKDRLEFLDSYMRDPSLSFEALQRELERYGWDAGETF